ncbi:unnamed protein product [Angiostrongylus costaricensis]|uniref:Ovule protein n=1 Tax=Angiostrongylus costaricensis TaxID=334426 RepID=A0A0R3Q0W8_ANGCS|nr:unnamed protein product [Angiostrongylus costaricensis]
MVDFPIQETVLNVLALVAMEEDCVVSQITFKQIFFKAPADSTIEVVLDSYPSGVAAHRCHFPQVEIKMGSDKRHTYYSVWILFSEKCRDVIGLYAQHRSYNYL